MLFLIQEVVTMLECNEEGILLFVVAIDGNKGLFPLVMVIVENETKDTWKIFLHHLHEAFYIEPKLLL